MEIFTDFMKNAVKDFKDICQIPSVELNTMIRKFLSMFIREVVRNMNLQQFEE